MKPQASSSAPSGTDLPGPRTFALFAEGWELGVGDVHGAIVLYDGCLTGMGRVEGDQVELIPTDQLPRAAGMRVKGLFAFGAHPDR